MTHAVVPAETFLDLAQQGQRREAARAADVALLADPNNEETQSLAALTFLHCGRFNAAKKLQKKLESATSHEGLWAKAALAVAFKPKDSSAAVGALYPASEGVPEYHLLAGVAYYQTGDRETGSAHLARASINPASAFTTAAAVGMRGVSKTGPRARALQVALAVAGLLLLGVIGLALCAALAEAINRNMLRRKITGPAHSLLAIDPPTERHGRREVARFMALATAIVLAIGGGLAVLIAFSG